MTTENKDRCPSCGILYTQHYGLNMTCKDLMEARAEVKRLKGNQEHRQRTYELLSRAETAEAEVDRLRGDLSLAQAKTQSMQNYAEAAEAKLLEYLKYNYGKEDCLGCQERDAELAHYKAALAESCDNMRAEGPYEGMGICPQLQEMTAERDYYKSTLQTLARGKSIESLIAREALEVKS